MVIFFSASNPPADFPAGGIESGAAFQPVSFPYHQREDTGNMINGRAFFIKSELSGSMKSDAFEYEIAVTSVRNRRFMLVHLSANPNPKGESFS